MKGKSVEQIDFNLEILNAVRDGIRKGVSEHLGNQYHSPLNDVLKQVIAAKTQDLRGLFEESIASCIADADFQEEIRVAVRHKMARCLIERFGGEMEKQVNALKSDPTTRARITLAIEEIVKQKAS